jgi:glycosyltransferase involved in cell wall biosynthesis
VVVDDGSRAPVNENDIQAAVPDSLIHLIRLPQNSGITVALNTGLKWIAANLRVKYVARLDCDDICKPSRFEEQVRFLNANPAIGLLGSWCHFRGSGSHATYLFQAPFEDSNIRRAMHSHNVFIHPTVMFRIGLAEKAGFYPGLYPHAEDYAFFWTLLQLAKGAILPKSLVTCIVDPTGISLHNRKTQLASCRKIISAFGTQPCLQKWGMCKTWLRQLVPSRLIFWWKARK